MLLSKVSKAVIISFLFVLSSYSNMTIADSHKTLTNSQVWSVIGWINNEVNILKTPFCFKNSYGNGVGKIPTVCAGGQEKIGAFCYDNCPSGYNRPSGVDLRCAKECPSDQVGTAEICTAKAPVKTPTYSACDDGLKTYPLTCTGYTHKTVRSCHVATRDWKTRTYCSDSRVPDKLVTRNRHPSCPSGYNLDAGFCVGKQIVTTRAFAGGAKNTAFEKAKQQKCSNGFVESNGMCYPACRAGHTAFGPVCYAQCASGLTDCGSGCATSKLQCGLSTSAMILGPAMVVANILSDGAESKAEAAEEAATEASKFYKAYEALDAIFAQYKVADRAGQLAFAGAGSGAIYKAGRKLQSHSAGSLIAITSKDIEQKIAADYPVGSEAYNAIAKAWANVFLNQLLLELELSMAVIGLEMVDPSGLVAVASAYAKPVCVYDKPMPIY